MAKLESIRRQLFIINKLRRFAASFEEISDFLLRQTELHGYDFTVSLRTFQRDLKEIYTIFGVKIQYDKKDCKYLITDTDEDKRELLSQTLDDLNLWNTLSVHKNLSDYVYYEKRKPQGTEHIFGLIHSIQNNFIVKFQYRKFYEDEASERTAEPYALKEFKRRWYLLAKDNKDKMTKTFGLDRILELEITKKKFVYPSGLKVNEMFKHCFGIINPEDKEPEEIILSFNPEQGKYVKSYPLHESQEVILENDVETKIRLKVFVTYDFIQEILSHGDMVKVVKPASLKKEILRIVEKLIMNYEL